MPPCLRANLHLAQAAVGCCCSAPTGYPLSPTPVTPAPAAASLCACGRPAVPSRFLEEALGPDVHYVKHRTRPGAQQGQQQRQRQQQRRRGQQDEQWEQPPIYSTRGARRAQAGSGARTAYARRAARQ